MQKGEKAASVDDLDEDSYDSEELMGGKIYEGNIYIFEYTAKNPTYYKFGGQSVPFYDSMPILLVTKQHGCVLRGINLNFFNKALKSLVLDLVQELDVDFYQRQGAQKIVANKGVPVSKNVLKFFSDHAHEDKIIQYLKNYKDCDYGLIFRNYSILHIKNVRLIEPWQWIDLPFLDYEGTLKKDILSAIWKLSGISELNI